MKTNYYRRIPPVCLGTSLMRLILGRLRYSKQHLGDTIRMEDGQEFTIFRHITAYPLEESNTAITFIIRFKFAKLSHKANKIASIIPMLLITGCSGFMTKIYAVNNETGYWQGMYQWKSIQALEEYKKSFVLKMMNKRAIKDSVSSIEFDHQQLLNHISEKKIRKQKGNNENEQDSG